MYTHQELALSRFFLIFVAGLAALGPLSIDAYLPTLPEVANDFGTDMAAANLTISTFMFGMAIGQFLGGPLSDQFGRRKIGLTGLLIHIIASVLVALASDIDQVLILRLIQAIGGGFAAVICLAQVRDVFAPEQVSKKFANVILVILIAPMLAPTLGTIISVLGWRAIFYVLAIYGIIMLLIYLFLIPETNHDLPEKFSAKEAFKGYWAAISKRTNGRLVGLRLALFSGFSAGVLFSYVTNAAFILIDFFGLSKYEFSAAFGLMIVMLMGGNRLSAWLLNKVEPQIIVRWVNLFQVCASAGMVLLCYFFEPGFWQVMFGIALLVGCYGATSPAAAGYFISLYDKNVGSASSLSATSLFAFGAVIGGISSVVANGELLPIFITMFLSSVVARLFLLSALAKPKPN